MRFIRRPALQTRREGKRRFGRAVAVFAPDPGTSGAARAIGQTMYIGIAAVPTLSAHCGDRSPLPPLAVEFRDGRLECEAMTEGQRSYVWRSCNDDITMTTT